MTTVNIPPEHLAGDVDEANSDMPLANTTGTSPTTSADMPSRLMSLARELRDMIYGELTFDRDIGTPSMGFNGQDRGQAIVSVTSGPQASLLRINKQFSDEYKEHISKTAILTINYPVDISAIMATKFSLKLPLKHITNIELHIWRRSMEFMGNATIVQRWATRLRSLAGKPLKLKVTVMMCDVRGIYYFPGTLPAEKYSPFAPGYKALVTEDSVNRQLLRELEDVVGVESIEVRYTAKSVGLSAGDHASGHKVWGTWAEAKGWVSGETRQSPSGGAVSES